ncbi:MAG: hypothetical protein ABWY19_13965 [Marmoricola sp.]
MTRVLGLAGAFLLAATLAACGGGDDTGTGGELGAQTCGVPTELVTAVTGTEDIEVKRGGGRLPVGPRDDNGLVTCTVSAGDDQLRITSTLSGSYGVAPALHRISEYPDTFDVDGAPAGLAPVDDDAFQATSVCGMVVTQVEGPSPKGTSDRDRRALLEAVAAEAGCARLPGTPRVATVEDVTATTEKVCGAPGDLVRELAGRDTFYVMTSGPALPVEAPGDLASTCAAYVAAEDDDTPPFLGVEASSATQAKTRPADLEDPFTVTGAEAATGEDGDQVQGAVSCRELVVAANAPSSPSSTAVMEQLLTGYAETAGCGSN